MTVSQHWDDTDFYTINFIYLEKMDDFTIFALIKKKIKHYISKLKTINFFEKEFEKASILAEIWKIFKN